MNFESDVHNFLASPETNIMATAISVSLFIWIYMAWWGLWEVLVWMYDPNMRIGNIPPPSN